MTALDVKGKTTVVNLRLTRYDVYIGRGSPFGNPYKLTDKSKRGSIIERYRKYFYERLEIDENFKSKVRALDGLVLGCFCKPEACHGDVIVEYLESINESSRQ